MIGSILRLAGAAIFVVAVIVQCRKPRWWIGRLIVWTMNRTHSSVTDWGLSQVTIEPGFSILDVGCGGGRTIQKLAAIARDGKVCGVDYSAVSVAAARRTNAAAIAAGHVEILQGSVSHLPFPDASFDLVTAVETHYYWPDLVADLREVRRVLAPGGQVVLVAESYRRQSGVNALAGGFMGVLGGKLLTPAEHREALTNAGFVNVAVREARQNWICAHGQSAGSAP